MKKALLFVLILLSFSSCSLWNSLFGGKKLEIEAHPNNTDVKAKLPAWVKVDLPADGYIVVKQKFTSYGFCVAMKPDMKVSITPFKKFNNYKSTISCDKRTKTLILKTKNILPIGSYKVNLDFDHDNETMYGYPAVGVDFKDKDFASEDDHLRDGAKKWAPSQKITAAVNSGEGDYTDWLKLEGITGTAQITLLDKSPQKNIVAHLFWVHPETDKVLKKRYLKANRRKSIPAPDEQDVFLRVRSNFLSPETKYTLLRKDIGKVDSKTLKVIDFIQVGETTWNAMLKKIDGVKVDDKIKIMARTNKGKTKKLGYCNVTSVDDSFINCTIESKSGDYPSYYGIFNKKAD